MPQTRMTARRISGGQPLRDAMARYGGGAGIGLAALSGRIAATGRGTASTGLLGFLTQPSDTSRHARETCSVETAHLIEDVLGVERGTLFEVVEAPPRAARPRAGNVSAR